MKNWKKVLSLFLAFVLIITGFQVGAGTVTASTATDATITSVSQPIDHFGSGVRFNVTLSAEVADATNGASVQGVGDLVQLVNTGDEFSHGGMDYYAVGSTLWVILSGVTTDDMLTIADGAQLQIATGNITVGDATYNITNSITLTYVGGKWVQDTISITSVSGPITHNDGIRFNLSISKSLPENVSPSGLITLATFTGMGDEFSPSSSYGYSIGSALWLIYEGVSSDEIASIPDGAKLTFTAGNISISDQYYRITTNVTLTYNKSSGEWTSKLVEEGNEAVETTITDVSQPVAHAGGLRFDLAFSKSLPSDVYPSGLGNLVQLTDAGDGISYDGVYGYSTGSVLWLIFDGVTSEEISAIKEGAKFVFTAGEITVGDATYNITNSITLTYIDGAWVQDTISITSVSGPATHNDGIRFNLSISKSLPENVSPSGLITLATFTGMGAGFSPSSSYGYSVGSELWLIYEGVSSDEIASIPDGAKLKFTAGNISISDRYYRITTNVTLTYNKSSGEWTSKLVEEDEISITGVSGLEAHGSAVRLRLYTSEPIGEANGSGAYVLGLNNSVTLSKMGENFNPTGSYGYVTYGESQILWIFDGVTIEDMPTIPEGAQITFTPSEVTIGDNAYNITNDVTWTYEDGSWIEKKDLPEISITDVSVLETQTTSSVRLRLSTSEPIGEENSGSTSLGLSTFVALSGMGDSFTPTDSYGWVTYGESQILWIFEGVTIDNMPSIPDGAQITFTHGEITIGDTLYYMTSDFSMTYDASVGKWLVTEGSVAVSEIAEGTSDTATAETGYKQISFNGVGVATAKNTNGDGGWLLYLTTTDVLPGTADDAKFTGIQISVNGGEKFSPDIYHALYYTDGLAFIWLQEHRVPQEIDKEYKITIHAGKGEPGSSDYEGIQLMEDYILTLDTNETWQLETVNTSVWEVRLDCDDISNYASDTFNWPCVFDGQETDIQMTYDGDTIAFSFPILEETIASNQYVIMTLKAGNMVGADGSTLELRQDVELYFNEHGLSVNEPIILDTTDVSFSLSSTSNAATLSLEALKEDAFAAGSMLAPAKGVVDGVYYREDNGIFMQGEAVSGELAVLSKPDTYTIQLTSIEISEGTELLLQGLYTSGDKLVEYTPTIFTWDGSVWSIQLQSTYVRGDANGDGIADIRDVVRANRYLNDNTDRNLVSIYANGANMIADSSEVNATDFKEMKLTLLGEAQIEMAAYSGPGYRHPGITAENWISESDFQDYMDCGFTYLFPNMDAAYNRIYSYETDSATLVRSSFEKSDLYEYMTLAEKMNIPVVPMDYKIVTLVDDKVTELTTDNKKYLSQMVKDLSQFDMFKGLTLRDEPAIGGQTAVKLIKDYLDELMPNMFTFTSHHPLYGPLSSLTTDTTKSKAEAYAEYIDAFSTAYGTFIYDSYPLLYEDKDAGTGNVLESTWFQNLELVAESAKSKKYDAGITIQSTAYKPTTSDGTVIEHKRPITSKADVGFQMYTALAYGMKYVNYYTYWGETDTSHYSALVNYDATTGEIAKSDAYGYVQDINWEIRQFDHVLLDFDWKGTRIVKNAYRTSSDAISAATSYTDERIESASVDSTISDPKEAIIGCMEDSRGRDGYMLVNATDPGNNTTVELTVKFKDATKATAYIEGEETEITLTDGSYTFTLNSGQGVFVVLDNK